MTSITPPLPPEDSPRPLRVPTLRRTPSNGSSNAGAGVNFIGVTLPSVPPLPSVAQRLSYPESTASNAARSTRWDACSHTCSRSLVLFITQVIVTLCIVSFCMAWLAFNSNDYQCWLIIGTAFGVWLPQPRMARQASDDRRI